MSASGNVLAPKQKLTRAEFLTLLLRLLHEFPDAKTTSSFKDVPADKWYSGTIAKAEELGIISSSAASSNRTAVLRGKKRRIW